MSVRDELRVHGVSGTPPREMLYTDPVTTQSSDAFIRIYRRRRTDPCFDTSAFHWGNLTSGSKWTALWILLAPFALANAAGWMAGWSIDRSAKKPEESPAMKLGRAAVRAAGLGLTGLFVSQALTTTVVVPFAWMRDALELGPIEQKLILTGLVGAVTLLFYFVVARLSTRSHIKTVDRGLRSQLLWSTKGDPLTVDPSLKKPWGDPGGARITDPETWTIHTMLNRLRRLHLGLGLLVVAVSVLVWTGTTSVGVGVGFVLVIVTGAAFMTTYAPETGLTRWLTLQAPWIGLGGLGGSMATVWLADVGGWRPADLHSVAFGIAAVLGVFVLLSIVSGPLVMGALVLATQIGAIFGATAGIVVERLLGVDVLIPNGIGWVAATMLVLIGLMVTVALALAAFAGSNTEESGLTRPLPPGWNKEGLKRKALVLGRRIEMEARWIFYAAALFAYGAFAHVLSRVWRHGQAVLAGTADDPTGFGGVLETLAAGLKPEALGQYPDGWVNFAVAVAVLGPGLFMIRSIRTGWNTNAEGAESRRRVGILWDLGSFWPRWYHPLAPPSYGDKAIFGLRDRIRYMGADSVLGAHSQGSLIAAVAIQQELGEVEPGFITYGAQLGVLYPRMFPRVGIPHLVEAVAGKVPKWVNLWRNTDPIGGHYIDHPSVDNRLVATGTGHSGHEVTPEYGIARREIAGVEPVVGPYSGTDC